MSFDVYTHVMPPDEVGADNLLPLLTDEQEVNMTTDTGEHMDDAMKTELLEKYGEREPKLFLQFDGFYPPTYPIEHDYAEDGYEIIASTTCELMNGAICPGARADPTTEAGDAVAPPRSTRNLHRASRHPRRRSHRRRVRSVRTATGPARLNVALGVVSVRAEPPHRGRKPA